MAISSENMGIFKLKFTFLTYQTYLEVRKPTDNPSEPLKSGYSVSKKKRHPDRIWIFQILVFGDTCHSGIYLIINLDQNDE